MGEKLHRYLEQYQILPTFSKDYLKDSAPHHHAEPSVWGIIIWVILGLLAIFPWITILSIVIYKFFQVIRLPKLKTIPPH